uniref:Uncharacterized protein n=1 Tax=Rangifer tarandus platyrhynchus TaxID=3082113 RepID=A0ACB0EDM9_RANTA|nr:unnamed protein product [Rangifer tarandus platyrhynchus]
MRGWVCVTPDATPAEEPGQPDREKRGGCRLIQLVCTQSDLHFEKIVLGTGEFEKPWLGSLWLVVGRRRAQGSPTLTPRPWLPRMPCLLEP